ncbi:hypothetical protein [Streptomyces sp. WAC06614]|uniref:hypothetical protein n=1 Tax=Streptomyces sp. WAC06614 TaxID=2487416 RepID=UPI000F785644|nr:hypothetical protein [Streptomyces sp. WAC06614]RSS84406.1 hypothetical protein EF918_00675 [Streptomyces sp. WAC06614]
MLAAERQGVDGQQLGLSVTGHAGYAPGAPTSARLSYSCDGEHWTTARSRRSPTGGGRPW